MNQEGPQVLFPGFTSKLQQEQNPEPCKTWGHTQPAHLPSFTRVPALQGRGTREGAGCLGMEKERPRFSSEVPAQVLWLEQSFSPTFSPALNLKVSKEKDLWSPPERRKGMSDAQSTRSEAKNHSQQSFNKQS